MNKGEPKIRTRVFFKDNLDLKEPVIIDYDEGEI